MESENLAQQIDTVCRRISDRYFTWDYGQI